jgi:hypothetical protein
VGPEVRIRLPPAVSLQTLGPSGMSERPGIGRQQRYDRGTQARYRRPTTGKTATLTP